MVDFEALALVMRNMLAENIILGPALSSVGIGGLSPETFAMIRSRVESDFFTSKFKATPITFPLAPEHTMSIAVARNVLCESILSTAAYYSYLRLGDINIDESMVMVGSRLIEQAIRDYSAEHMFLLMYIVNSYDNYQAITHYQEMMEDQFISGELHRPWIHYTLEDELGTLVDCGSVQRVMKDGKSVIALTDQGRERYNAIRSLLKETGFIQKRSTLMRFAHFSQFDDYDQVVDRQSNMQALREKVLRESTIKPGMKVLELGCGTGGMTLDAGLHRLVGTRGQVIATDPAIGMLTRARNKLEDGFVENVKFVQAAAEDLPFENDSFDAVLGCAFLHFTNIPGVLREVYRVAKHGATFTTVYPLNYPHTNEFFGDWFAPVLSPVQNQDKRPDILPDSNTVPNALKGLHFDNIEIDEMDGVTDYRDPEGMVEFIVQVSNFFESIMNELPWRAKEDMVQFLIRRGHQIQEKYRPDQLIQIHPNQFLKARVRKSP